MVLIDTLIDASISMTVNQVNKLSKTAPIKDTTQNTEPKECKHPYSIAIFLVSVL